MVSVAPWGHIVLFLPGIRFFVRLGSNVMVRGRLYS